MKYLDESGKPVVGAKLELHPVDRIGDVILTVSDSRGVFTFEEWQKMPPEVPPSLKPWWRL